MNNTLIQKIKENRILDVPDRACDAIVKLATDIGLAPSIAAMAQLAAILCLYIETHGHNPEIAMNASLAQMEALLRAGMPVIGISEGISLASISLGAPHRVQPEEEPE